MARLKEIDQSALLYWYLKAEAYLPKECAGLSLWGLKVVVSLPPLMH